MSPTEAKVFMDWVFSLWYVAVIFPILGSGLAIWAHSLRIAYQRRDFGSFAVAGWNTFAQVRNTLSAVDNLGGTMGSVGDLFKGALGGKGDAKGKLAILAIMIVVISLVGGFMIAFGLVRYFARTADSRIERILQERATA